MPLLLVVGACANENPQTDEVRAMQSLALSTITTKSDEARAEFNDGVNEFDNNRLEEGYEHFKRAIAADPEFAMAELYASRAAFSILGSDVINAHLKRAMQLAPHATEIERLEIQADNALNDGNVDEAIKLSEQMVKVDADGPRSWLELALMYQAAGQEDKGRSALEKAAELAPQ